MPQLKIGVLLSGGGTNFQSIIDNINSGFIKNAEIKVAISNRKASYGLERAKLNNIDAVYVSSKDYEDIEDFNDKIIEELEQRDVNFIVLAGYLKILSAKFIKKYKNKIINVHPSLIPSFCGMGYYGIKVHEEAIKYGVKVSGATVHLVDETTDTGPIILQDTVSVDNCETAESLQKKVLQLEHTLLPLAVKLFSEDKIKIVDRNVIVENFKTQI